MSGPAYVYEVRQWAPDSECLYTTDPRVHDLAIRNVDLAIVTRYYQTPKSKTPNGWDIVGPRASIRGLAQQFVRNSGARARA